MRGSALAVAGAPEGSVERVGGDGVDLGGGESEGKAGDHGGADREDVGEDAAGEGDFEVRGSRFGVRDERSVDFAGDEGYLSGEVFAGAVEDGGGDGVSLPGEAGDDGSEGGEVGGGASGVAAMIAEFDEFAEGVEAPSALDFCEEDGGGCYLGVYTSHP